MDGSFHEETNVSRKMLVIPSAIFLSLAVAPWCVQPNLLCSKVTLSKGLQCSCLNSIVMLLNLCFVTLSIFKSTLSLYGTCRFSKEVPKCI